MIKQCNKETLVFQSTTMILILICHKIIQIMDIVCILVSRCQTNYPDVAVQIIVLVVIHLYVKMYIIVICVFYLT